MCHMLESVFAGVIFKEGFHGCEGSQTPPMPLAFFFPGWELRGTCINAMTFLLGFISLLFNHHESKTQKNCSEKSDYM